MAREPGPRRLTLLLSHLHWDHIQGLPFFLPAYMPDTEMTLYGPGGTGALLRDVLLQQMNAPVFPVHLDELPSKLHMHGVRPGASFEVGPARVRASKQNHPGGVMAFRVDHGGHSVVYATDNEHYACVDPSLCALARGADVLIYDAQYTPEEYRGEVGPSRVGWGHSTFEAGAELARAAHVGTLVLFHHDPSRSDQAVEALEQRARLLFPDTLAARETIVLEPGALAHAA
jgi:ribonuclease BN (tRNA processing enzyme)